MEKTVGLGNRMDLIFHNIRIGLFWMDHSLIKANLEKATTLMEEGGKYSSIFWTIHFFEFSPKLLANHMRVFATLPNHIIGLQTLLRFYRQQLIAVPTIY